MASHALKLISILYKVEEKVKDCSEADRSAYRQAHARPILEKLKAHLLERQLSIPPKSTLGKAVHYFLNEWAQLITYCDDGWVAIDNNPVERAIRPFTIGRKNWMFHGHDQSARAAANIYTLIESAKQVQLNVQSYLKYVFDHLPAAETPEALSALLPHAVKAAGTLEPPPKLSNDPEPRKPTVKRASCDLDGLIKSMKEA